MDTDSDTDSSDSRTYAPRWPRKRRRAAKSPLKQCVRSLAGFIFGLFLASVYGCITFFLQHYGFWYCLGSTVTIAALCAFGMGLSVRVRTVVSLMLPTLCCTHGKNLLMFLIFSMVTRGPLANTLENFNRAAQSVACGAELAMNQTRQLVERASAPLRPVLGKIKQITKNAYAVAGRVQSLISTLTESVNHIARMLRNVLYFLVRIGDVCEEKLGSPYRKCVKAFNDAKRNCTEVLDAASGICDVVSGMQDLCNLTKVTLVFCVVPIYVMTQMKTKLAAPTVAALEKMQRQFEFEISVSAHLDVHVNSSRSVQQVSQEIMEEVTAEVSHWRNHMGLFAYMGLIFLALTCLQAVWYRRKYLDQDDYDNIYITDKFVMMDLRRSEDGRSPILPLTRREALIYIRPWSLYLTEEERRAAALNTMSVLRHMAVGGLLVALDLLVFWMFDTVYQLAQREIFVKAPVMVAVSMNGSSYASDMFKDIVAAFDVLQKGNITVLSKKCLIAPSETNYYGYMFIGLLYGFSLFIVVAGSYIKRLRRFVCASYYPKRERERVQFLYNHILSQRASLQKVLLSFPGGSCLADFFGVGMVCCVACGKEAKTRDDPTMLACSTPKCTGLLCFRCHRSLGTICPVCMGPLIFQEDSEEEIDSSDDQQVGLWTAALTSMRLQGHGKDTRQLLKLRVREALRRKPAAAGAENSGRDSDTDSDISVQSSTSGLDMTYQEQALQDDSESSDHDPEPFLAACVSCEDKTQAVLTDSSSSHDEDTFSKSAHLQEVMVHSSLMPKPAGQTQEVPDTLPLQDLPTDEQTPRSNM
ncbi:DC-STAMP domain-containing protein 2 isoform X2 [Brienomyrus brachyistius]|uniref:DC-STAMP domain-containing protein 2 isoform X2 n=1 Tax=Brienomyrus brachyistius TaxID=42636 RepID=UPI0020B38B60|nr:DC-STAMP domain-containing protein 2 isoform X2 [Brienomyrus brachyistius]